MINSFKNKIHFFLQEKYSQYLRKRLNNKGITILSRDCTGGLIYHQLGLRFNSPTINLYFGNCDFCLFSNHLEDYINTVLTQEKTSYSYPVGLLNPKNGLPSIRVFFMHYKSFNDAFEAWERRKIRIDYDNIFVLLNFCGQTEFDNRLIEQFNRIKYKKVFIIDKTNINLDVVKRNIDSCFIINKGISKIKKYHSLEINQYNFVKAFNRINCGADK